MLKFACVFSAQRRHEHSCRKSCKFHSTVRSLLGQPAAAPASSDCWEGAPFCAGSIDSAPRSRPLLRRSCNALKSDLECQLRIDNNIVFNMPHLKYHMDKFFLQFLPSDIQNLFNIDVASVINQLTPDLPHPTFVTDLAIIMIIGSAVTLAFFKIRQPLIIGYLFAGMLIGPLSPLWSGIFPQGEAPLEAGAGILADIEALNLFAEIGVILLMFVIGMEFPYSKLRKVGRVAMGVGTIGIFATMIPVMIISNYMGLTFLDSLFIGAALSISSTAIIVKILTDTKKIERESSMLVLAILIVEDVIAVILISSLQSIALIGTVSLGSILAVIAVAAGLLIGTFTIGIRTIPNILDRIAAVEHREILLLAILGVCFGYSLLANVVGLSVAIGAFLAGVLVAETKSAEVARTISTPIKDMFVAIFFISVGALMDITDLDNYLLLAVILIGVATAMKLGGNFVGSMMFNVNKKISSRTSFTLAAPRGEFSIVIVKAGIDLGAVSAFLFPLIGIVTIVTAFMSPFFIRAGDKISVKIAERDAGKAAKDSPGAAK